MTRHYQYKGALYRLALSPEQKQLKRQYRLEQSRQQHAASLCFDVAAVQVVGAEQLEHSSRWPIEDYREASPREASKDAQDTADRILFWWNNRQESKSIDGIDAWHRRWNAHNALLDYVGDQQDEPEVGDRVTAYRATNRRDEPMDVEQGVEIISRNHATGELERGMSVALGLEYAGTTDLNWIYAVEGVVVDFGSDGEPVLQDVQVVGPLRSTDEAVAWDWAYGSAAQRKQRRDKLTQLTGLPFSILSMLADVNWFRR